MMSQFAREILSNDRPEWVAEMVRQDIRQGFQHNLYQDLYKEIRQEGRQEEAASMLLKQLHRKFGQTPDWVTEKVKTASLELIETWSDNFVFANSVDDVFAS